MKERSVFKKVLPCLFALLLTACGTSNPYTIEYFGFKSSDKGRWGLINLMGEVLCENEFKKEPTFVVNDRFSVPNKKDLQEIYEASDNPQVIGEGVRYKQVGLFTSKYAPVLKQDGTFKYIDKKGAVAIDLAKKFPNKEITEVQCFVNDRAIIKMDGKYGAIDMDGKLIVPCKYENAYTYWDNYTVFFEEPNDNGVQKWYLIDKDGKVLMTKSCDSMKPIGSYNQGKTVAIINKDEQAIIDDKGNIILKLGDKRIISGIFDDKFVYYEDDSYGLMDTSGTILIKAKYDDMQFNGCIIVGMIDKEWYLLDEDGKKKKGGELDGRPMLLGNLVDGADSFFLVNVDDESSTKYIIVDNEGHDIITDVNIDDISLYGRLVINKEKELDGGGDRVEEVEAVEDYPQE